MISSGSGLLVQDGLFGVLLLLSRSPAVEERVRVDNDRLTFLNGLAMALAPFLTAFPSDAAFREIVEGGEESVDAEEDLVDLTEC